MVFGMASTQGTGYYLYNYKEDKYEPLKIKTVGIIHYLNKSNDICDSPVLPPNGKRERMGK